MNFWIRSSNEHPKVLDQILELPADYLVKTINNQIVLELWFFFDFRTWILELFFNFRTFLQF